MRSIDIYVQRNFYWPKLSFSAIEYSVQETKVLNQSVSLSRAFQIGPLKFMPRYGLKNSPRTKFVKRTSQFVSRMKVCLLFYFSISQKVVVSERGSASDIKNLKHLYQRELIWWTCYFQKPVNPSVPDLPNWRISAFEKWSCETETTWNFLNSVKILSVHFSNINSHKNNQFTKINW